METKYGITCDVPRKLKIIICYLLKNLLLLYVLTIFKKTGGVHFVLPLIRVWNKGILWT